MNLIVKVSQEIFEIDLLINQSMKDFLIQMEDRKDFQVDYEINSQLLIFDFQLRISEDVLKDFDLDLMFLNDLIFQINLHLNVQFDYLINLNDEDFLEVLFPQEFLSVYLMLMLTFNFPISFDKLSINEH